MLEPCCRELRSFDFNGKTMQVDVPRLGHNWLSRYVIALVTLPRLIMLNSSYRLCGRGKMNRPTTTLYGLR